MTACSLARFFTLNFSHFTSPERFVLFAVLLVSTCCASAEVRSIDDFEAQISGRWQQVGWSPSHTFGDYNFYESGTTNIYTEFRDGHFSEVNYGTHGELYKAFGGRYWIEAQASGDVLLKQTIEYFSPYAQQQVFLDTNGQAQVITGEFIVGAQTTYQLRLDGNTLEISGYWAKPNSDRPDWQQTKKNVSHIFFRVLPDTDILKKAELN